MKRVLALLGVITFIAVFLRLFNLGKTPIALEWDEVALGYDAYSIIQTGRDQFGHFLPINFRSLDDWKPPLYVYSSIPGIFLFGLNDFTVRLPSAVFGLGLFSYHSTRVVTPLLLISLIILFRRQLPDKKTLIGFFGIYLVFWLFF